jgi:glutamyl-tRNA reductase
LVRIGRTRGTQIAPVGRELTALAGEVGGTARPLEALESELRAADVVVSARRCRRPSRRRPSRPS